MKARLKKRYPKNHRNTSRWLWQVRTLTTDGGTCQADTIDFHADRRDTWTPKPYKGRVLARMTATEAEARMRDFDNQIEAGKQDKPEPTRWDEFVEGYLGETRGTVRATTLEVMDESFDAFATACAPKPPRDVSAQMVKRFVQAQLDSGLARATVKKRIGALRRVWNDRFKGHANPFADYARDKKATLRSPVKDWHIYAPDEVDSLLRATLDARRRVLYLVAYSTALRRGELFNLTWADVGFEGMTLKVNPKADTEETWAWGVKDVDRRIVPMPANVKMALLRMRARDDASLYVFLSAERYAKVQARRKGGRPVRITHLLNNVQRGWEADCKRAEIPFCEFHSLRRSCITLWLSDNVPPHEVQRWAGHADITTTIRHYSQVQAEAANRVRKSTARRTAGLVA